MVYKAASFFSGIGGIDLAFSWLGFDIRFQCEIDEYCQRVLQKHKAEYWPNARLYGDIRNVTKTEVGQVDVMFGGFPCQDISIAGKRDGVTKQTRSGLWFELLRIIGEVRPRIVLLENVSNISNVGGVTVTATLAEIGYDAIWIPLRASDVGAPHQRERWFCVAYSTSKRFVYPIWDRNCKEETCKIEKKNRKANRHFACMGKFIFRRVFRKTRVREFNKQSRVDRKTNGLSEKLDKSRHEWPRDKRYFPEKGTEYLVPYELEAIARNKALGNAVVPQQVLPIARAIKNFLDTE